jgi:hypothetical protein
MLIHIEVIEVHQVKAGVYFLWILCRQHGCTAKKQSNEGKKTGHRQLKQGEKLGRTNIQLKFFITGFRFKRLKIQLVKK